MKDGIQFSLELARRGNLPEEIPTPLTSEFKLFCVALAHNRPTEVELAWVWDVFSWRAARLLTKPHHKLSPEVGPHVEAMGILWRGWKKYYDGLDNFDETCMHAWQLALSNFVPTHGRHKHDTL